MHITTPQAMHEYGKSLASSYNNLLLTWDLWAGKTTLIKGFAEGLGINPHSVQSPTYAYVNSYDEKLLHIDMYRLEHFSELMEKWILNLIAEYEYVVIEWPKWIDQLDLGEKTLALHIEKISASERKIIPTQ